MSILNKNNIFLLFNKKYICLCYYFINIVYFLFIEKYTRIIFYPIYFIYYYKYIYKSKNKNFLIFFADFRNFYRFLIFLTQHFVLKIIFYTTNSWKQEKYSNICLNLDFFMSFSYNIFPQIIFVIKRRYNDEKNISAEKASSSDGTRFP